MLQLEIRDAVKQSQRRRGLRTPELAEKMLISGKTLSRRLAKPQTLTLEDVFRMAKALGWSEEDLFGLLKTTYADLRQRRKV